MPNSTSQASRRYVLRLAATLVAYTVSLVGALLVVPLVEGPWRYAVLLVPVAPAAFVAVVVLRYVRETDELQGRIVLESLAGAFALGSLLTFGYGFLQIAGAPDVSWLFVWPVYGACWLLTSMLARRRY